MGSFCDRFIIEAEKKGRSDSFIDKHVNYARVLAERGIPIIYSTKHLAMYLNMDYKSLEKLLLEHHRHYSYFCISKKSGGKRRIIAPLGDIRKAQYWLKKSILDKCDVLPCATGFVQGKSIKNNALPHVGKNYVLKVDLQDFFESISEKRVYGIFRGLGYAKNLSVDMAKLCTTYISDDWLKYSCEEDVVDTFSDLIGRSPFMVQGAPTSPELANLACRNLDRRLMKYAQNHGVEYTRYADDLTFSTNEANNLPSISFIRKVIEDEGFTLNDKKTRFYGPGMTHQVTGLYVDGRLRVPGKYKREIYRHLHFCEKYGLREHFEKWAPDKGYAREWLYGKILYVNMVEPDEAKKMLEIFNRIDEV